MEDHDCWNVVIGFSENKIFFFPLLYVLCGVEKINGHHFFLGEDQLDIIR